MKGEYEGVLYDIGRDLLTLKSNTYRYFVGFASAEEF